MAAQRALMEQARGVYLAWWQKDGCRVLYAVNSRGQFVRSVLLRSGVSYQRAHAWLSQLLDRVDPVRPKLELVTPNPAPKLLTVEQIEALYRDSDPTRRLLWQRKLAKARGGTFG